MIKLEHVKVVWEWDECPDLSWLGEYTDKPKPGAINRVALGNWRSGEYIYFQSQHLPFNPRDWDHVDEEVKAEVVRQHGSLEQANQAYAMQDYKRMEDYNQNRWHMTGCWAEATVSYNIGQGSSRRLETLSSSGLWGIESDSSIEHKAEVAGYELASLKAHLEVFGVDLSNWDALTEGLEYTEV